VFFSKFYCCCFEVLAETNRATNHYTCKLLLYLFILFCYYLIMESRALFIRFGNDKLRALCEVPLDKVYIEKTFRISGAELRKNDVVVDWNAVTPGETYYVHGEKAPVRPVGSASQNNDRQKRKQDSHVEEHPTMRKAKCSYEHTGGPYISTTQLEEEIIKGEARASGDPNASLIGYVFTEHGKLTKLWGSENHSLDEKREVYYVVLAGNFYFRHRVKASRLQFEIDATTGELWTHGSNREAAKYYDHPNLLAELATDAQAGKKIVFPKSTDTTNNVTKETQSVPSKCTHETTHCTCSLL